MLPYLLLGAMLGVFVVGFGVFFFALKVGGQFLLFLFLVVLLAGVGLTVFSISDIGSEQAAPVTVHKEYAYGAQRDATLDWTTLEADPYFRAFAGIVVALVGCVGCMGCAFSKVE